MFKLYYLHSGKELTSYILHKVSFAENNDWEHHCFNQYKWHKSEDLDFIFVLHLIHCVTVGRVLNHSGYSCINWRWLEITIVSPLWWCWEEKVRKQNSSWHIICTY